MSPMNKRNSWKRKDRAQREKEKMDPELHYGLQVKGKTLYDKIKTFKKIKKIKTCLENHYPICF